MALRNLGVVIALILLPSFGDAGTTPGQKCAVAKNKAAAKKTSAKLKCWQKAIAKGMPAADSACLSTAESKFHDAIVKAESSGSCVVTGDETTIENAVDACVTSIVNLTPATTTTTTSAGSSTTSTTTSTTTTPSSSTTSTTLVACDPLAQNCPAGEGCYPSGPAGVCETSGTATQGAACQNDSDCAAGYACVNDGTGNECLKLCRVSTNAGCTGGTTCTAPNGYPPDVGVCIL
jgi:hypothetical protein